MIKRFLSSALAFILMVSIVAVPANASSSNGLSEAAKGAVGKSYSELGLPSSNWCGYFVGYCINNSTVSSFAGEEISRADSMNPITLINWACAKKRIGTYYSLSSTHYSRLAGSSQNLSMIATTVNDFIPMPGDIIVFDWDGREDENHVFSHAGIVTEPYNASSGEFAYVDGNSGTGQYKYVVRKTSSTNNNNIIGYIRVNGQGSPSNDCATHTNGTYLWCEKGHPHYNYFVCAVCGKKFTDGTTAYLDSCAVCNELSIGKTTKPIVSVSSNNVTASWTYSGNASHYDVYLVQNPWAWEDIKYHLSTSSTSCTFENVRPGDYCAFVIARPNSDTVQSEWTGFTVDTTTTISQRLELPSNFFLFTDKDTYTLGESVVITPSADNTTHYAISIWRGAFKTGEMLYVGFAR